MAIERKNNITVELISKDEAEVIIKDPEIYDRITDDYCPTKDDFVMPDAEYIGGFVGGELASVYVEDRLLHFQVLKKYRGYASALFKKSIKSGKKVIEIPVLYQSVIAFAEKMGFKRENIIESTYRKNGYDYDIQRLVRWDS